MAPRYNRSPQNPIQGEQDKKDFSIAQKSVGRVSDSVTRHFASSVDLVKKQFSNEALH